MASSSNQVGSNEPQCAICLKEMEETKIGKLPCQHMFCFLCIEEWLQT